MYNLIIQKKKMKKSIFIKLLIACSFSLFFSCQEQPSEKAKSVDCLNISNGKYYDSLVFRGQNTIQILYMRNNKISWIKVQNNHDESKNDIIYFDQFGNISNIHVDEVHKWVNGSGVTSAQAWIYLDSIKGVDYIDMKMRDSTIHIENPD